MFLFTAGAATAGIAAALFLLWKLLAPGIAVYVPSLQPIYDAVFCILGLGVVVLYGDLWRCAYIPVAQGRILNICMAAYLRMLYPLARLLGRICGLHEEAVSSAYIQFLNRLVILRHYTVAPDKVLILAPHCLQWDQCPHKITRNVANCRQCGKCPVGAIRAMAEQRGSHFAVATGGTLARQIVHQYRPKAIIAIACERDLISGIQDIFPLPVLGLLNERPYGPCFNTQVDMAALQKLYNTLIGEQS